MCPPASSHHPQHLPALLSSCSPFASHPPAFLFSFVFASCPPAFLYSPEQRSAPGATQPPPSTAPPRHSEGSEAGFSHVDPLHHSKCLVRSNPARGRHREPFSGPFKLLCVVAEFCFGAWQC